MSSDQPFTPHADSIQTAWVLMCQQSRIATQPPVEELEAEFDRFLARVKRDALAAAEHRATRAEAQSAIRGRAVAIYQRRAREAEAERDWNWRSSRHSKIERIKANARADRAEAEARIHRHRADDMEDNALRTQGNLRAMKERLETAETRIKAVRDILNHHGNDGPVALDALQALNNPDGSPDQPCGRGPCALGNNHTGPCRR